MLSTKYNSAGVDINASQLRRWRFPVRGEPRPPTSLLHLASELRNLIYFFTLQEAEAVVLSKGSIPPQPSITQTCRQIRKEALPLYYSLRDFHIKIEDYDVAFWMAWEHSIGPENVARACPCVISLPESWLRLKDPVDVASRKRQAWACLLFWLENFYCNKWRPIAVMEVVLRRCPTVKERAVAALFALAKRLHEAGLPWEKAKPCLLLSLDMAESKPLGLKEGFEEGVTPGVRTKEESKAEMLALQEYFPQ